MSLSHMAGSVVGGALVVKFVPTPFIVVGIAMALSYGAVRLLIWLVRALIERLSRIEVKWPDLGYRAAKARIEALEADLTNAQMRAESEVRRVMEFADSRIVDLERELQIARDALQVAGEELRQRPHEPDPLYRRVGLDRDCPDFVLKAARRAYRVTLHEDKHPPEHKRVAHEKLVAAEQVFDTLFQRRGLRA
jgi:hypothetical protein